LQIISDILSGDKRAIAGVLNLLEEKGASCFERNKELIGILGHHAKAGRHVIGITGPPGSGKSTLMSRLISEYRARCKTVGVIAVDPTSRRSGGALLGDRARISHDSSDKGLFIRSMAAGSHLGGLAWRTRHCLTVFEAVYDVIILETVGVGQSETEVGQVADTVVFVAQPGSGDLLQFIKAGIMEIPHIIVVNKADQKVLAARARGDLTIAKAMSQSNDGWDIKIVLTSAMEGWGQQELVDMLEGHKRFLVENGLMEKLRYRNRIDWISMLFKERFGDYGLEVLGGEEAVRHLIAASDTTNPLDSLKMLEKRVLSGKDYHGIMTR
jgi:LAO/AO transport system kinase